MAEIDQIRTSIHTSPPQGIFDGFLGPTIKEEMFLSSVFVGGGLFLLSAGPLAILSCIATTVFAERQVYDSTLNQHAIANPQVNPEQISAGMIALIAGTSSVASLALFTGSMVLVQRVF